MFRRLFGHATQPIPSRSVQEACARLLDINSSSLLIDVRECWEYRLGHAKDARNMPLSRLSRHLHELPHDRELMIICLSGHRSLPAAIYLQEHGLERVVNVEGGTWTWWRMNLPMRRGK